MQWIIMSQTSCCAPTMVGPAWNVTIPHRVLDSSIVKHTSGSARLLMQWIIMSRTSCCAPTMVRSCIECYHSAQSIGQ